MAKPVLLDSTTLSLSSVLRTSAVFSHTVTTSIANRLLVVSVIIRGNESVSGTPTYAGLNLSLVHDSGLTGSGDVRIYTYIRVNPTTGPNNVSVNFTSGVNPSVVSATTFAHVRQFYNSVPADAVEADDSGTSAVADVNITTVVPSSLIWGIVGALGGDTDPFTPDTGQTEDFDTATGVGIADFGTVGGTQNSPATPGSTEVQWTASAADENCISTIEMARDDYVQIHGDGNDLTAEHTANWLVWTAPNIGYAFFFSTVLRALIYRKTTNGGLTWGGAVGVSGNFADTSVGVWYDRWTPGDKGTKIHVTSINPTSDLWYRSLDTFDDSLSTLEIVHAITTITVAPNNAISITKARSGRLYIAWWANSTGEYGFEYSDDEGDNWSSASGEPQDGNSVDWIRLVPGNEADKDDIYAVYMDRSANALTYKHYDASGDNWPTETTIDAGVIDEAGVSPMSCAVNNVNNHIFVGYRNNTGALGVGDYKTAEITNASTVTARTDVISNTTGTYLDIVMDQTTGDLYYYYMKGTPSRKVYYKKSTNGGTSWGSEVEASSGENRNIEMISQQVAITRYGGVVSPFWYDNDTDDCYINPDKEINISATPRRAIYIG